MSIDELHQRTPKGPASPVPPALLPYENETGAWSSGELFRLFVAPALVTLLLVGGVYWIRLQMPAGSTGQQQTSVVQVHLLPRPDSAPIVTASASHSTTQAVASRTDTSLKEPDPATVDEPAPVPRARTFSSAEAPPSNILSAPSAVSGPASSAAIKFQQALMRHVAQYQRYPNAARALRLQGKVDTQFSMSRDGKLLGVWVRTSSGQSLLDKEAMETIRRAQPLPPIPSELPDRLNIHVQLVFDPS
ncbi:TonB family protein [Bradyrhizobium sp. CSA112]|uniref:energy transducer TonB family protein n=1 Tax=Bradyrhizobium sp. CSA112 TaxID=2699170 RepID=UPI0023AFC692|nr:energy transducer TonB [Bradyrhizobium sp. CSA112]MDE5457037.1 TonB family protein [Bradyrhizobium sp. CSA112]